MSSPRRDGPHHHAQPAPLQDVRSQTTRAVRQSETPWWSDPTENLDWWTSPSLAYWRGLRDGARLALERQDVEDERAHRDAVRRAVRIIDAADRRARFDRGVVE